jgi:HSP20 family protein
MPNTDITRSNGPTAQRPVDIFGAMRDEMDRMFERFEHGRPRWPTALARTIGGSETMVPELDVHDNAKQLTIEVDLPGIDEKDVAVTLVNGLLTIKGERKSEREEKNESYYMAERSYGAFERSLRLPDTIDENKREAKFDKGVLKIVAHKKPEAVKAEKRIEIKKA